MSHFSQLFFAVLCAYLLLSTSLAWGAETSPKALLEQVRSVGPKGANHQAAHEAARRLQSSGEEALLPTLAAMKGAGPLAMNWLRGIAESIASQQVASGKQLPIDALEKYFADTDNEPRSRRLAYELIASVQTDAEQRLIPTLQADPSLELRFDAIRLATEKADTLAKNGDKAAAITAYRETFAHARDISQIKALTEKLKELGETVDLPRHLGYITKWRVIGPFDNIADRGWDTVYDPETKVDFAVPSVGKTGSVQWKEASTDDPYGVLDLNTVVGKEKGAIAYAASIFVSDRDQTAELRLGCINATKIWVNGEIVESAHVYHAGMEVDQYRATAKMNAGKNIILVKVCQNEQTEPWAQDWKLQLRVCDSLGTAILTEDHASGK